MAAGGLLAGIAAYGLSAGLSYSVRESSMKTSADQD